ncbi:CmcJ/NvfI family oxidoreductase [Paraburkholderia rhizosphaerae]|uniref:Methyltransferase n=1 Tax=Paraburkholderia rhizosphaerae TaxID=480658 RepID=A0A4R8M080_9BURK|nr:CmcJ/NvfI family oxidoreductase [Paraburkholderia rhizosphaerae]TDY53926.1 hypothetical protein BX592_10273 [Paraburkholderia rhizosphaerae]
MSDIVIDQPVMVEADLNYLVPTGEKPSRYMYDPPPGVAMQTGTFTAHRMPIVNARVAAPPGGLSIDRNGFELHGHTSALDDFSDPIAIKSVYYPESEQLIKRVTGARRVVIFDHTLRDGGAEPASGVHHPVKAIHNDQTFVSGRRRVRDHAPAGEVDEWLKGHTAIVNLWRPIGAPIESAPLAMCDSRSIALNDLIPMDLHRQDGEVGEVYAFAFSAQHRWFYFPQMTPEEVLLLKIYDSAGDGIARLTAHTAFDDPTSAADALPRRSIELRTLLLF